MLVVWDLAMGPMSIAEVGQLVSLNFVLEGVSFDLMVNIEDTTEGIEKPNWLAAKVAS